MQGDTFVAPTNFSEFIAEKGVQSLHVVTNCPPNTIYMWTFRNLIPRKYWPELIEAYPEITLTHLKRWETQADRH